MQATTPSYREAEARVLASLPLRPSESHKGSYGNALLYCGSTAYTGAAMLAAMGALRAGAGITHLAAPEVALLPVRIRLPEVVCHPIAGVNEQPAVLAAADQTVGARGCILIGCGIGRGNGSQAAAFREALSSLLVTRGVPIVLDADALNMISTDPCATKALLASAARPLVLTPHPAEFARLTGLSVTEVQANRHDLAAAFAKEAGVTLLLKGRGTVVAAQDGSCTVNPSGSPALAKGGSGDVLAGVITGLIAGGMPPTEAAFAAAFLHGAAGEWLERQDSPYGLLPSDLPAAIAREMQRLTSGQAQTP